MGVVNVGEDRDGDLFRTQSKDLLSFVFVTVYIYIYLSLSLLGFEWLELQQNHIDSGCQLCCTSDSWL